MFAPKATPTNADKLAEIPTPKSAAFISAGNQFKIPQVSEELPYVAVEFVSVHGVALLCSLPEMAPFLMIITELSDTDPRVIPRAPMIPEARCSTLTCMPQMLAVAGILNPKFSAVRYLVLVEDKALRNIFTEAY